MNWRSDLAFNIAERDFEIERERRATGYYDDRPPEEEEPEVYDCPRGPIVAHIDILLPDPPYSPGTSLDIQVRENGKQSYSCFTACTFDELLTARDYIYERWGVYPTLGAKAR